MKRDSGGARETERKRRAQAAVRPKNYSERSIVAFNGLPAHGTSAGGRFAHAIDVLCLAMDQAATDPGMPPEYRREQAARIGAAVVKAVDPKRMNDDHGPELREAHADLAAIRSSRAAEEPSGDPLGPEAAPH